MTRAERLEARREAREAFIIRYSILSVSGLYYGPDELIRSVSRFLCKRRVEHPGKVARKYVEDDAFMLSHRGEVPSSIANAVWLDHIVETGSKSRTKD